MSERLMTYRGALVSASLAVIAGCQLAPGTAVKTAEVVTNTQGAASISAAQKLGLVKPNGPIGDNAFQILGKSRQGVASAVVQIADRRLVADSNGVVELPHELVATGEPLIAAVFADGMVSARKRILPGQALVLQPVDPATTPISATSGGKAVNSDGNMEVVFGPGALDRDAVVHVTARISANPPSYESVHPSMASLDLKPTQWVAYGYHLDLGGATILPDASVVVKWKVENDSQDTLKMFEHMGILQEMRLSKAVVKAPDGSYWYTMRVPGPKKAEEVQAPSAYRLLGAACNPVVDVENYNTFEPVSKPVDKCEVRIETYFTTNGVEMEREFVAIHDDAINDGNCFYPPLYGEAASCKPWPTRDYVKTVPRTRDWPSSTINALVRYRSNDSRISDNPVAGARVTFAHEGTPMRDATTSAITASNGYASGSGKEGASGTASATYPAEPFTWGTSAGYSVNCSTASLYIVKNKGQLSLSFNNTGTPVGGGVSVGSSHGSIGLSGFSGQTVTLAHNNTGNVTETVNISGGNWSLGGYQVDMNPASGTLKWNDTNPASLSVWHNATLTAVLKYLSNDTTVPADQRPVTRWNGQAASNASVNFNHVVSTSSRKPAGRDILAFTGVSTSQTTWGVRGNNSAVSASVAANGITLTGNNSSRIDNTNVDVLINANLPKVVINYVGDFSEPVVIGYTLDGSTLKTMNLPAPTGSSISFHVPVEDVLNEPNFHRLSLVSIANRDFSRILAMPDGSTAYTELTALRRGGSDTIFPETLVATTNAAK